VIDLAGSGVTGLAMKQAVRGGDHRGPSPRRHGAAGHHNASQRAG
jgi:hypothetical protein